MNHDDTTLPGTRQAQRDQVSRQTLSSAVLGAVARIGSPGFDPADLPEELKQLYEHGREAGRLQRGQEIADAEAKEAQSYERATRLSQELTTIRGVARRLRDDGVPIPGALVEAIWSKEIR